MEPLVGAMRHPFTIGECHPAVSNPYLFGQGTGGLPIFVLSSKNGCPSTSSAFVTKFDDVVTRHLEAALAAAAAQEPKTFFGRDAVHSSNLLTMCCAQGHDPMINHHHSVLNQPDPIENKGTTLRSSCSPSPPTRRSNAHPLACHVATVPHGYLRCA